MGLQNVREDGLTVRALEMLGRCEEQGRACRAERGGEPDALGGESFLVAVQGCADDP